MRKLHISVLSLCILLFSAGAAFAADGHGSWSNLGFRVLNLALVVGVVYYFFGKKIVGFFKGRTEGIATELTSLESRKAEAQKSLANVEQRIADLEQERQAILSEYKAQGETLKASIIAQAEKSAVQITEQAKTAAENEIKVAIEDIRLEMAEKIVEATEELLTQKLSEAEHGKLIDKYLTTLTKVVLN